LLDRDFKAEQPDQKWVADITYIATDQGWLYLATVMDLFSRKIIGWSMQPRMKTDLVADALKMALARRRPDAGLLHHSDRGSQFTSIDYQKLLAAHDIQVSMSRTGSCYDNAAMESFFATLKTECVDQRYATRQEARACIFDYIEVWYNRRRRHSSLEYLSPEAYERRYARDNITVH
jgi:putative transposase